MSALSRMTQPIFTGDSYTLRESLSQSGKIFPLLVKTCGQFDFRGAFKEHCDKLPIGEQMLIEQVKTIEYALVRVLDYHSEDNVSSEKGGDFVLEHNNYVGNQYLVPLKYQGTVRLTSPPGCRNRYACVSQVLEDLPQYLIVNADTVALTGDQTPKVLSAGHRLAVNCSVEVWDSSYLKCTDDSGETFLFKDNAFVNFTGDYSKHEYNLFTASKTNLPRCILFENVDPADVVIENDNQASVLMVVVSGPLQMLKVKKRTMLVAWLSDKENKTFRLVLIPEGLWDIEHVQLAKFSNESAKEEYIASRFWSCIDSSLVVDKLYLRMENKTSLTYLKRPPLMSDRISITEAFSSHVCLEESHPPSPPPPVPERVQNKTPVSARRLPIKIYQNEGEKSHKQHQQQQVQEQNKPKKQPRMQQEMQNQPEMRNVDKKQIRQMEPTEKEKRHQPKKELQSKVQHHSRHHDVLLPKRVEKERDSFDFISEKFRLGFDKIHNEIKSLFQATTEDRSLKPGILKRTKRTAVVQPRRASDSEKGKQDAINAKHRRSRLSRSLSTPGTTTQLSVRKHISLPSLKDDDSERTELSAHLYNELEFRTVLDAPGSLPPSTLGSSDTPNLSMAESKTTNLKEPYSTREHFYSYSVAEVCECFLLCRLNDLAKICMAENLDGNFFKDSNLDFLSEPPFNLGHLSRLKVEKVIGGWRPKES